MFTLKIIYFGTHLTKMMLLPYYTYSVLYRTFMDFMSRRNAGFELSDTFLYYYGKA